MGRKKAVKKRGKPHSIWSTERMSPPRPSTKDFQAVSAPFKNDFLKFEGNAQTLRLVARLQNTLGPSGLNLTAATLAALMKYTVPSSQTAKGNAATKKFGYFASESDVVDWIRDETGLEAGQRHPLTWLMELRTLAGDCLVQAR
jgi:dGTPase